MPLVPAKCPECGGNINIEANKRAAICEFCKQPFVVEDAINNFNTIYNVTNNNEIKADVVNVYEGSGRDFIIKAGVLENYEGERIEVNIPNNVREIAENVFYNCIHLKNVNFSEGIQIIGNDSFSQCRNLEEIVLPKSLISVGSNAFKGCSALKKVTFAEGTQFIGNDSFSQCRNLEEVVLPKSLISIGYNAFKGCSALKKLRLPIGVKKVCKGAFSGTALPRSYTEM